MKKLPSFRRGFAALLILVLGVLAFERPARAVTFSVTPAAISNQYTGFITLQMTGLNTGETIQIDKYVDANSNGIIDASDMLAQSFQLTDGQVAMIGGVTNGAVPGDLNTTAGAITAQLNFGEISVDHLVGQYLFRLSSPVSRFAPITNSFNVTNTPFAQAFSGSVKNSNTNVPFSIIVLLMSTPGGDHNFAGGVIANSSGNYNIPMPPGTYLLSATKSNFVGNASFPFLTLSNGISVSTNLFMSNATETISGKLVDSTNSSIGLPGIEMPVMSTNGSLLAFTFTDSGGNFIVPVTATSWKFSPQSVSLDAIGYVGPNNSPRVNASSGSVSGVSLPVYRASAMLYGKITDGQGHPMTGVRFYGQETNDLYQGDATSDANGNYYMGALPSNWDVEVDTGASPKQFAPYVFSMPNWSYYIGGGGTNLTSGKAVRQDFSALSAPYQITGHVTNAAGGIITNVTIFSGMESNGIAYTAASTVTDSNGFYSMNVCSGFWTLDVDCSGDKNGLGSRGNFNCPDYDFVNITNASAVADFIVVPCGQIAVTTTNLPDAEVGSFYYFTLGASSCSGGFTFSLSSGSPPLPNGLSLDSAGDLSGQPTTNGVYHFSVHVVDGNNNFTDQQLTLTITNPPLQVLTSTLPDATEGFFYSTSLDASGGTPPYVWSLSPHSAMLPPNITIDTNGVISGTPTIVNTYIFTVRVTDSKSATADQELSLTTDNGPLQILTVSLPNGTNGYFYSDQLVAIGGAPPYHWSLSPGSATPPPNLALSTNGLLSGSAGGYNGTNYFWVRVTDSLAASVDQLLSLTLQGAVNQQGVFIGQPKWLGHGEFSYNFNTVAGVSYTVMVSADLKTWTPVASFTGSGGPLNIVDYTAGASGTRYYRVKSGP